MTVSPPRQVSKIWTDNSTALDYEIAQEKAAALGRLGRALEAALAALRDFDAQAREPNAQTRQARRALVAQAGHALWLFVVQRDSVGLRDGRQVMRDYAVPAEVQNRMGAVPARASPASHRLRG